MFCLICHFPIHNCNCPSLFPVDELRDQFNRLGIAFSDGPSGSTSPRVPQSSPQSRRASPTFAYRDQLPRPEDRAPLPAAILPVPAPRTPPPPVLPSPPGAPVKYCESRKRSYSELPPSSEAYRGLFLEAESESDSPLQSCERCRFKHCRCLKKPRK